MTTIELGVPIDRCHCNHCEMARDIRKNYPSIDNYGHLPITEALDRIMEDWRVERARIDREFRRTVYRTFIVVSVTAGAALGVLAWWFRW